MAVLPTILKLLSSVLWAGAFFHARSREAKHRPAPRDLTLQESEERFALAMQASSDGIWDWNVLTDEVYYSPRFKELLGYDAEELENVFATFESRLHSDDRAKTLAAVDAHLHSRVPYDAEYRLRTKTGDYRWFRARGHAIWDDSGNATRMVGSLTDISVRKQAEEARNAMNDRLNAVLDAATQVAIIATDMTGLIGVFNSGAERMLQYGADEAVGKPMAALIHLESEVRERGEQLSRDFGHPIQGFDVLAEYARQGSYEEREWTYVRKDGSRITVDLVVTALKDRTGTITGFLGIAKDVTESKRVDAALKQEQYLLRMLLEHLPDSIYFKDRNSRFLRIGRALSEKFGLRDSAEAVGKTDYDFFTAEHAQQALDDEQALMRTGQPLVGMVERETWPDGHTTWVATSKMPLRDDEGNIVGSFGLSRDITEQKRAEERFRLAVEASPNALVMVDQQGKIMLVNSEAEKLFGYERSSMRGMPVELLIPLRFHGQHVALRAQYFSQPKLRAMGAGRELYGLRRDGSEFPLEVRLSPIETEQELVVLASIVDITERKKAEDALRQAKETAEAASHAKSVFLANMSHEIRTPMNAVIGMTELVLDTPLAPNQREYLAMVLESGESLLSIINEILDFSKIEACRIELDERNFNLREWLGDALKSLGLRAHRKGLELAYHVATDVPETLRGDAGRLRQVVVNLLGNAIKFTQQGEVILDVSLEAASDQDLTLHFSVADTGIGIPAEKHAAIFQAFEQADNSTTRRFGGTGLGLAISARIVELMGGKIWLESEPDRGSTFHFTTRMSVGSDDSTVVPAMPASVEGLRVLVVDDNATNRRILAELLLNWRMQPTTASGVVEALKAMREAERLGQQFSLILSDMHMPELDGFDLARQVGSEPQRVAPIIIMLTSGDNLGDRERSVKLGIAAYLIKPVKQSELLESILTAIGTSECGETPALGPPRQADAKLPPLTILLAEDSLVNQKLAVGWLEKHGHRVSVVGDGLQAVEALKTGNFDLVLMDVQMPVMDGLQATQLIRADEYARHARVPIIAMTAHAMKGDRERCLEAGMDGYVAKPIHASDLFGTIGRVLSQARSDTGPPNQPLVSSRPFDLALNLEAFDGNRALLQTVAATFCEEAPRLVQELHAALACQDAETTYRLAHTLKGNCLTFQAGAAAETAARLEERGRSGNLCDAPELLAVLGPQIDELCRALGVMLTLESP